jgi:diguanylate cyclase (GGDEF)-like protein
VISLKKKSKGSVNCSTYIENLVMVIVHSLNALKVQDEVIDSKIDALKELAKQIKYEENTEKLMALRDQMADFAIEYDEYTTKRKTEFDKLVLVNINMLLSFTKNLESSKKWQKMLDEVKEILKEKLDVESLKKTKEILVNLGYSTKKDSKDVVYSDIVEIIFSMFNIESDSKDARNFLENVKEMQEKISSNPANLDIAEVREQLKSLVDAKLKIEEEYIQSVHLKLNKALKALIYTITTFSSSSGEYVDVFQGHIDEINDAMNSGNLDIDEISKRLIGIAIKIKDTTINMKNEIEEYSKKMDEAKTIINSLKNQVEDAKQNLIIDPLTGAYNRRGLLHFLKLEIERAVRYNHPVSIIMADLDKFSNVNNTYGHLVGDTVLKKFCKTAQSLIRGVDVLTRYGGEEFIVILPNSTIDNAFVVAEKIRTTQEGLKFKYKDQTFSVTVSMGVAQYREGDTIETFIDRADKALYVAKKKRNFTSKGE